MNWENQLARTLKWDDEALAPAALKVRNLCRQTRYGEALEILWSKLLKVRKSGSREREAFVLIHMGKVYRNWIWDLALKFFRDGLSLSRSCGFSRGEMIACNAIGELYYAWGKQDKALEYYRLSLDTACELQDAFSQRDILLDMVECYGEIGAFSRCDELLQEAAELDQEMGMYCPGEAQTDLSVVR